MSDILDIVLYLCIGIVLGLLLAAAIGVDITDDVSKDCEIKIETKTVCEDKACDFASSNDSLFRCPDCSIIKIKKTICKESADE